MYKTQRRKYNWGLILLKIAICDDEKVIIDRLRGKMGRSVHEFVYDFVEQRGKLENIHYYGYADNKEVLIDGE